MTILGSNPLLDIASQTARAANTTAAPDVPTSPNSDIEQAARDFEAAFIGQMLKYSGFGEALTKSGGEEVAAFTDFYLENISQDLVNKGGFGLAESFYDSLMQKMDQTAVPKAAGETL